MQVVNVISTIDRRDCSASSNITIKHTVHHHRCDAVCSSCTRVITHNTCNRCATSNRSIAEAVDDTCIAANLPHNAAHIGRTVNATTCETGDVAILVTLGGGGQNAAVVDSGSTSSLAADSTGIASSIASVDGSIFNDNVLDGGSISVGHERTVKAVDGVQLAVDGSCEGLGSSTNNLCNNKTSI